MPPPVEDASDGESTGGSIPFENNAGKGDAPAGDQSEEEDDEGVYVVEKILGHEFGKGGVLLLQVKWKGYENPEDLTVEPEENLIEGAKDVVEEYYRSLGGRPEKPVKKRKSMAEAKPTPEKAEHKRRRKSKAADTPEGDGAADWVPKGKSWENDISRVDTIIRDTDDGLLYAYLHWTNGKKSKVSLERCYQKCPMKMLRFYQEHLVFKNE